MAQPTAQELQQLRSVLENYTEEDWKKLTQDDFKQLAEVGLVTPYGQNDVNVDGYDQGPQGYSYKYENGNLRSYNVDAQRSNMQGVTDRYAPRSEGAAWGNFLSKFVAPAVGAYGAGAAYNAANGMAGASLAEGAASQAAVGVGGAAPGYGAVAPGVTAGQAAAGTTAAGAANQAMSPAQGARAASEIQTGNGAPGPNSGLPEGNFTTPGNVTSPSGTNPFTMETVDDWWDWDDIGGSLGKLGSGIAGGLGSIGAGGLLDLVSGLYQSNRNRQTQSAQMDLFKPYNEAGKDYLGRLNESYDNPESYLGGAEYGAIQNTVHNQLQRKDAAGGKLANAFPRQAALEELAMTNLSQYRQGLSGTMNNLAAIGTGQGQINALNQRNSVDAPLISSLTNLTDPNRS